MEASQRFEQLRQLLAGEPSPQNWERLLAHFEAWPEREARDVALSYADEHLEAWPSDLRSLGGQPDFHSKAGHGCWQLARILHAGYFELPTEPHEFARVLGHLDTLIVRHLGDAKDVALFAGLTRLSFLTLGDCRALEDVDGLSTLTRLEALHLDGCRSLKNVDGLANLPRLSSLSLRFGDALEVKPERWNMGSRAQVEAYQKKIRTHGQIPPAHAPKAEARGSHGPEGREEFTGEQGIFVEPTRKQGESSIHRGSAFGYREESPMSQVLYKENLVSTWIVLLLGVVALVMGGLFVAQLLKGPIGSRPAPTWVLGVMFGFFALVALNFAVLQLKITDTEVIARYGLFRHRLPLSALESCEEGQISPLFGYGIRFAKYRDRWIWAYNVIGAPSVVCVSKEGSHRSLLFSTQKPQEIVKIVSAQLQKSRGQ